MFIRLGTFVARHWLAVIVAWGLLVVALRWLTPAWDDVTQDGDMAYLPERMPSVVGERLLAESFPKNRAKSQIALIVCRENGVLTADDLSVAQDLARRFENLFAAAALTRGRKLTEQAAKLEERGQGAEAAELRTQAEALFQRTEIVLEETIRLDESLAEHWAKRLEAGKDETGGTPPPRLAAAYFNRDLLYRWRGMPSPHPTDQMRALELEPTWAARGDRPAPEGADRLPLLDVWTWRDDVFGSKLGSKHKQARLVLLQLSNEFMATDNIRVLDYVERELRAVEATIPAADRDQLRLGLSGSAAIGGDMLRAAKESIKNTELFTILFVVLILGCVYRSPSLIGITLATMAVSLATATSLVAALTQVGMLPGMAWWKLKVFTTTKVFIVAILYGSGTDYFLFLLARYKEELEAGHSYEDAIARALGAVGDALAASALTTILGLATMFFADFGKFANSGPVIGFCLVITLLACVTVAPAFLRGLGRGVFWPGRAPQATRTTAAGGAVTDLAASHSTRYWERLAEAITAYPGRILVTSVLVLSPIAYYGLSAGNSITYDLLHELPAARPSKQGAELMKRYFPVGESGPLIVVVHHPDGHFDTKDGRTRIHELTGELYLEGVEAVRSITDPLGDFPPGAKVGLFSSRSWLKRVASPHARTQDLFVATTGGFAGEVTRLDLILKHDPFSPAAIDVLTRVEQKLRALRETPDSVWRAATFAFSGTTAGVRDLKLVTQGDNRRIQILVVLAVLAVLLVLLKRPLVCLYMVASVLFGYYVTLGATAWFFAWVGGVGFQGLDWRTPIFLFVLLVALGEDYNVYLATRVVEEQQRLGPLAGLRRAVVQTGGIITSCGVIMAGTFIAMTSGTWGEVLPQWLPLADWLFSTSGGALRAVVQLGFALALGVLLDTFIVRPILLPAFLTLLARREVGGAERHG